jgi:hypothetical protein
MKECNHCGKEIYFGQVNSKWVPLNSEDGSRHFCKEYQNDKKHPLHSFCNKYLNSPQLRGEWLRIKTWAAMTDEEKANYAEIDWLEKEIYLLMNHAERVAFVKELEPELLIRRKERQEDAQRTKQDEEIMPKRNIRLTEKLRMLQLRDSQFYTSNERKRLEIEWQEYLANKASKPYRMVRVDDKEEK